jgi:KaiC/GvpD/RAD55 family RecA-like ATPase
MSLTITDPAEQTCVDRFVNHVNSVISELFGKPRVVANVMSDKWIKIEKQEMRDGVYKTASVYCFIARQSFTNITMEDVVTGGIYKAKDWKAAAKHHRGNIYDNTTFGCAGKYGIEYLPPGRKAATV